MALNFVQIGKHIGEIRKRRGLFTAEALGNHRQISTYVSYIESGLKCMSLDTFVSSANALHVSADELLKDNIENTIKVANHEFASLIADCSEYEKRILLSILNTAKAAMRENRHLLISRR